MKYLTVSGDFGINYIDSKEEGGIEILAKSRGWFGLIGNIIYLTYYQSIKTFEVLRPRRSLIYKITLQPECSAQKI